MNEGIAKVDLKVFDETLDSNITATTGLSPAAPIQELENYKQIFIHPTISKQIYGLKK
ncbi:MULTISPECIES: hypothetical protein [Nostoc]|uniref:Uncharacterized protein n=1 Tax=Nostoc paludosum FACHB-159 TaxID=2692908 RepID=A0ABR8KHI1_9NOSO|nr:MULTISPECIES: hypothetical protein [Nostoc]MBD2681948.1 hypothetical protein [Nostoc sp. FACHB-857]MBD2738318.1 hypothetical protein [Nostoc paludosum FACHB-159]